MKRKEFLKSLLPVGTGFMCCGAALGGVCGDNKTLPPPGEQKSMPQDWINRLEERTKDGARTPAWRVVEFAHEWVLRLMKNMDELLDPETRGRLMNACGRSCFIQAFGVASEKKAGPEFLDRFLQSWQQRGDKDIRREGNTIYYQYGKDHVSPYGLSIGDGLCLCPLVETLDKPLSKTYCQCSVGYVKELFERIVGKPVEVRLLESLRTGGKICRFKIDILTT
jgi:hypothetical protein